MKTTVRIAAFAFAVLALASCQEFFTSSWGAWAERDASVPSGLTAAQALDIADTAAQNCDTELAQALLPQMADFLAGTPSDELVEAAVDTAVLASGVEEALGESITELGSELLESGGTLTGEQITAISTILESVTVSADALEIYDYINGMTALELEAAGVTASDCALAAAALLIEEAEEEGVTVEDVLDGTATLSSDALTTPDYYTLAQDLLTTASTLSGGSDIYSLIDGMF